MPENLKWLLIGGAIVMFGDFIWSIVLKAKRRGPEQKAQEEKLQQVQSAGEKMGEDRTARAHSHQLQRLVELLDHMSMLEAGVYGHQSPLNPAWESLTVYRTGNGTVIVGTCRGVDVGYNVRTGVAYIQCKYEGISRVDVDLKTETLAFTTTALLKLFTDKKEYERTKAETPTPVG